MRRWTILVGAVVALGAVVAFAWFAPTVLVAAPLWVMALCVITGVRPDPPAVSRSTPSLTVPCPQAPGGFGRERSEDGAVVGTAMMRGRAMAHGSPSWSGLPVRSDRHTRPPFPGGQRAVG